MGDIIGGPDHLSSDGPGDGGHPPVSLREADGGPRTARCCTSRSCSATQCVTERAL
jgi:hypothetical protein